MKTNKNIVRRMGRIKSLGLIGLMGLMILMGLVGCSEDSNLENRNRVTFEAQSLATGFEQEQSGHAPSSPSDVTTRAWTPPTGYYLYTDNNVMGLFAQQTDLFYKSIDVFFTQDGKVVVGALEAGDEGHFLACTLFLVKHHAEVLLGRLEGDGLFFTVVVNEVRVGGVNSSVVVTLVFHGWCRS